MDNRTSTRMNIAMMLAATMGSLGLRIAESGTVTPKMHRYVPSMVTASPEEIAAWNAVVAEKKPRASQAGIRMRREDNRTIGHRQAKREAYLHHEGYAERHPVIAHRFAF
jgi:hypothetical protein